MQLIEKHFMTAKSTILPYLCFSIRCGAKGPESREPSGISNQGDKIVPNTTASHPGLKKLSTTLSDDGKLTKVVKGKNFFL